MKVRLGLSSGFPSRNIFLVIIAISIGLFRLLVSCLLEESQPLQVRCTYTFCSRPIMGSGQGNDVNQQGGISQKELEAHVPRDAELNVDKKIKLTTVLA